MNSEAEQMRRELVNAYPALMTHDFVRAYAELGRAVKMVPGASHWALAASEIALYALRDGLLFVAAVDPSEPRVVLCSRRLDPARLDVTLEWEEGRPNADVTAIVRVARWSFAHPGPQPEPESWQRIEGTISLDHTGQEHCDRRELFARELARLAGWESFA